MESAGSPTAAWCSRRYATLMSTAERKASTRPATVSPFTTGACLSPPPQAAATYLVWKPKRTVRSTPPVKRKSVSWHPEMFFGVFRLVPPDARRGAAIALARLQGAAGNGTARKPNASSRSQNDWPCNPTLFA